MDKQPLDPDYEDYSASIRAEMMPASDIKPEMRRFRSFRINPAKIWGVFGFLILIGLGWSLYMGPLRPGFERMLLSLVKQADSTPTETTPHSTSTQVSVGVTSTVQTITSPTSTAASQPSVTASLSVSTPTNEPSETPASDCVDVELITLEDLGIEKCVRGIPLNFEERSNGFLVVFSDQPGAMYWVSYDITLDPALIGECIETTGEVMQIADSPVLVFGYQNQPHICSTP